MGVNLLFKKINGFIQIDQIMQGKRIFGLKLYMSMSVCIDPALYY